jgi:hypothetical protein
MKMLWTLHIIIMLFSCGKPVVSTPMDKAQVISQVKQMLDQYHHDIGENGLTAEFKYLDQSEDFFWVPPGYQSALSFDSVKTILENNAGMFSHIEFTWDTLQIFPLTTEIATYAGIVIGKMTDTSGIINNIKMIESGTLILRKDGWKLLSGQTATMTE